jgi:hypothetical protein
VSAGAAGIDRHRVAALFCLLALAWIVPRDLVWSDARFVEVWLGFELHGALARATAPLHWAVFAVGAWAFWRERPWAWSAAAAYAFYVALSHVVWSLASPNGGGAFGAAWQGALFSLTGFALWRWRPSR